MANHLVQVAFLYTYGNLYFSSHTQWLYGVINLLPGRNLSPKGNSVFQEATVTTFICSLIMLPGLNIVPCRVLVYPELEGNVKDKL